MSPSSSAAALTLRRRPYPLRGGLPYVEPATDLKESLLGLPLRRYAELALSFGGVSVFLAGVAQGMFWAGAVTGIALASGAIMSVTRRSRAVVADNARLIDAMDGGRLDEAVDGFRRIATRAGLKPQRSVAVANLAVALSRRGEHHAAMRVLALAEKEYAAARKQPYGQLLAMHAAHFLALDGDAEGAQLWLDEAGKRGASAEALALLWTPVLISLRRGRTHDALAQIDQHWLAWETKTPASSMRRVRLLKAFALSQDRRPEDEVTRALEGTRPFNPGDYTGMASDWPELRAFIVGHGLADSARGQAHPLTG